MPIVEGQDPRAAWGCLHSLWTEHQAVPFPAAMNGGAVGLELVVLDAEIAGLVASVLAGRRPPDAAQRRLLRDRVADLDRLQPEVPERALSYVLALRELAETALLVAFGERRRPGPS